MSAENDQELLLTVLERDDLDDGAREAFTEWSAKLHDGRWIGSLTPKQRAWARAALKGERYEPEPEYENLVSSGRVPRGREVELLVKDKPLRPPGRR